MKTVKITTMKMHYFKGVHNRTIEFGENETIVSGGNGCGKSTIMDAFFWCLWGKNAQGQSDQKFLIKTVDKEGNEIPNVDHEVEIELTVNGERNAFRRVMTPKYDKDGELKGNVTSYYWNDVPLKMSEYNQKVSGVVSEEVFKMTASPFTFLSMEWQKQREMLIRMSGDVADNDVARGNEDFEQLLRDLNGKTIDEYRREIDARLKRVNDSMRDIPARIDEAMRTKTEVRSMDELDRLEQAIRNRQNELAVSGNASADLQKQHDEARNALVKLQRDLAWKQQQIVNKHEAEMRNDIHVANLVWDKMNLELQELLAAEKTDSAKSQNSISSYDQRITIVDYKINGLRNSVEQMRSEWVEVRNSKFAASDNLKCPLYGHTCSDVTACGKYADNRGNAIMKFEADKEAKLKDITERGKKAAADIKKAEDEINELRSAADKESEEFKKRSLVRLEKAKELKESLAANPKRPLIAKVDATKIAEWVSLQKEIVAVTEKLADMPQTEVEIDEAAEIEKKQLQAELCAIIEEKTRHDANIKADKRSEELQEELASLGEQKADLEYRKNCIGEFEIAKTNMIGDRVNQMFKVVRWKMFQRQVNGEEIPTCICLCNGVRWQDANTASRINAGIDVASTLAHAYGVSAPMFIDNAESCADIYNPGTSQRILLKFETGIQDINVFKN